MSDHPALAVSIKEAAKMTSLSIPTLYRMMGRDEIASYRVGSRRLIKVDSLHKILGDA